MQMFNNNMDVKTKFANKEAEIVQGTDNNHTKLIHLSPRTYVMVQFSEEPQQYTTHAR
jgi:ABC-type phosphate/phosphonate transport system substrate-binding protein